MKVTLNSDDMTVSNTNLPHEYQLLEEKNCFDSRGRNHSLSQRG